MRNRFNYILAAALGLMSVTSCSDDLDMVQVVAEAGRTAPVLNGVEASYTFEEATIGDNMIISWGDSHVGQPTSVSYTVYMDKVGGTFEDGAVELGISNMPSITITRKEFNKGLLTLGLIAGNASQVDLKVVATHGDFARTAITQESVAATVGVTPWADPTAFPDMLYLAGSFQGWNNANEKTILTPIATGEYQGFYHFNEADTYFKILTKKGDWASQWGERGGADGILDPNDGSDPDALNQAGAGFYKIYVNFATKEYTITPVTWGVIGSATPGAWSSDQDMTYNAGVYSITLDLVVGELKFRVGDDWTLNVGEGGSTDNAPNIQITEAGSYTITLDVSSSVDGTYSYTITRNDV